MQVCDFARSFLTFRIDMLKKQPITVYKNIASSIDTILSEVRDDIADEDGNR